MVTAKQVILTNISLAYDERGDASNQPLIFVHGSASDYRTWNAQMGAFAEKYHVFAYSRRSHYPNAYTPYLADYSIKTEVGDLAALIPNLTSEPAHLVGWSYGAYIAVMVAKDFSPLVRSLVLMEPPIMSFLTANPETTPIYLDFQREVQGVKKSLDEGNSRNAVERFIDAVSGARAFERSPPEYQKRMLQNAKTLYELTSAERDPFNCGDARAVAAPTLLLTGERSPPFLHTIVGELCNSLLKKECATIKNASHPMHSQNPIEYNDTVLRFLNKH